MITADKHIRDSVESFVKDIDTLIRQAAVAAVADALGVGASSSGAQLASPAKARRDRKPNAAAPTAAPASARPARGAKSKGKRIRRSSNELDAVAASIQDYISKNGGQGAEQIKKALKLDKSGWMLPLKKLMDERRVTSKGQKRGTTYFASK